MKKRKLLIVNSEMVSREIFVGLLEAYYIVMEAENIEDVKCILQTISDIDVVIIDESKELNDIIYTVKADKNYKYVPIMILANDKIEIDEKQHLKQIGVDSIVSKPYSAVYLKQKIDNLTGDRQEEVKYDSIHNDIVLENTKTFMLEYNYVIDQFFIDPAYKHYVVDGWQYLNFRGKNNFEGLVFRPDIPKFIEFIGRKNLNSYGVNQIDARLYIKPHVYEWFRISIDIEKIAGDMINKVTLTFSNAEQEISATKRLKFLMSKDPLTHLANIDTFADQTTTMIYNDIKEKYAIVRANIDNFRIINQLYGNKEGDNILRFTAVKLQEFMETEELGTYCRISSDIFGICIRNIGTNVENLVDYLQQALKQYPMTFNITMSFGVYAITGEDCQEYVSVLTMLDRAAEAERAMKVKYTGPVGYYTEEIRRKEQAKQMVVMEMHKALEKEEFKVFLQPKCEMSTGKIIGSEALARWQHPEKGLISPADFIPIFEKNGFITVLDFYVLETVCIEIRKWLDNDIPAYPVSVNLSRTDLYNPNILDRIFEIVERYKLPHNLVEFEITESGFATDNRQLIKITQLLQENGFKVLMDDFGSGYSSLNLLKEIPVDVLKLDLKFLPNSSEDVRANVILQSVVEMSKKLDLNTVVEGVETAEQAEFMISTGCEVSQGFYFYRPMPMEEYEQKVLEQLVSREK